MKVEDLDIQKDAKEIIHELGIEELYPPQEEGVEDVISGRNCVFALPTASGKSFLAYIAIIKKVVEEGGKALYIVPLRALASEKTEELKIFEKLGMKIGISMGDYDNPDPSLKDNDVIIATSEKADSLLRQNMDWLDELTAVIADEVHLIDDRERGSTLEVTLSKLKQVNPSAQIIALSATIRNSDVLAEWLDANHHKSDWRPVELNEGVFHKGEIQFSDGQVRDTDELEPVPALTEPIIEEGDQCLVFVGTRKSTEAVSKKMSSRMGKYLDEEEKKRLEEVSEEIRNNSRTSLGERLADGVESGVAFHNAGLSNYQRKKIENTFRNGLIKLIGATPKLAAGINMPARRVVIRDCRRYDPLQGYNAPLPVIEVKQMSGRAGRPGYDDIGEAVLVAKNERDTQRFFDEYVLGKREAIVSKMATEPALRKHLLALVATGHCFREEDIFDFMRQTFYAQHSDIFTIEERVRKMIMFLKEEELIEEGDGEELESTEFGKRVSDVYIDPLSAVKIKEAVESGKAGVPLSYLHTVCQTPDMYSFYINKTEMSRYRQKAESFRADLLQDIPHDEVELEEYLSAFKTALMLKDWMNEVDEDDISERYGIGPGDIRNKVETAEWLLHASSEIAKIYNRKKADKLKELTERVKYGIKEELTPLMGLEQIGRVRARTFFENGYKTAEDVSDANQDELKDLPGVGEKISTIAEEEKGTSSDESQSSLQDF